MSRYSSISDHGPITRPASSRIREHGRELAFVGAFHVGGTKTVGGQFAMQASKRVLSGRAVYSAADDLQGYRLAGTSVVCTVPLAPYTSAGRRASSPAASGEPGPNLRRLRLR